MKKTWYVKTDSRSRISLTKCVKNLAPVYRVTSEESKIILEPLHDIPQEDAWLFLPENRELLTRVKESLRKKENIDMELLKRKKI